MNTGLAQARAEHPHTCAILQLHFEVTEAPKHYYVDHILEALDRDLGMEIKKRYSKARPFSEWELWYFLAQTVRALASAHAKVRNT